MVQQDTAKPSAIDRFLNGVEWAGNKLPHPFAIFLILYLITAIASSILAWRGTTVVVPGSDEEQAVQGLFTAEGMAWFTTTLGQNYIGFPPLVTVLPILLAVGVAERSGMLAALIRKLFGTAHPAVLPYAVGIIGVTASVMGDASMVIVPPLAAMVFKAAGRHPVAGLIGGFAAVGAGYSTALVPTSLDALFAGITTAVMETLPGTEYADVTAVSNYYFNIAASLLLGLIAGFLIDKVVEPRLWRQQVPTAETTDAEAAGSSEATGSGEPTGTRELTGTREANGTDEPTPQLAATLSPQENRALLGSLGALVLITAVVLWAVLLPDSPWRNEEGGFLPRSPLMSSIVFLIFLYFLTLGLVYGAIVGTVRSVKDMFDMMLGSLKDMLPFLVLAFILGQFVALFAWTGIGTYSAVHGAAFLESIGLTGFTAILAFILLASLLNLIIISGSSMWTLMAAVFVPMFALLGYEPAFVQAAFRVGDSATQIITPLNPYLIVMLGLLQRYEPQAGIGTLMSRLIPFVVPFWIAWALLLAVWFFVGLPLGPGNGILIGA